MATAFVARPAFALAVAERSPAQTAIDGVTYLLGAGEDGVEWVSRYEGGDMAEIFTAEQRRQLALGETIILWARHGAIRWTDMVAATRAAALAS